MADLWVTFDCYGTLIDWDGGIHLELGAAVGEDRAGRLLKRYHELEPQIQVDDPAATYRDVMARALERLAEEQSVDLAPAEADAFGESLPGWGPFPRCRARSKTPGRAASGS